MRLLFLLSLFFLAACAKESGEKIVWYDQSGVAHSVQTAVEQDELYVDSMDTAVAKKKNTLPDVSPADYSTYIDADLLAEQGFRLEPQEQFYTWIDETGFVRNESLIDVEEREVIVRSGANHWALFNDADCCNFRDWVKEKTDSRILLQGEEKKLFQRSNTGLMKRENEEEYFYSLFDINHKSRNNNYLRLRCYEKRVKTSSFCQAPEFWLVSDEGELKYSINELKVNFHKGNWKNYAYYEITLDIPLAVGLSLLSVLPANVQTETEWFVKLIRNAERKINTKNYTGVTD